MAVQANSNDILRDLLSKTPDTATLKPNKKVPEQLKVGRFKVQTASQASFALTLRLPKKRERKPREAHPIYWQEQNSQSASGNRQV